MSVHDMIGVVLFGAVSGIVYALYGIIFKRDPGEPIRPKSSARTIVLFTAGGVLIAVQGGEISVAAIEARVAEIGVLGIAFDHAWSGLRKHGYLDWFPGVSPGE